MLTQRNKSPFQLDNKKRQNLVKSLILSKVTEKRGSREQRADGQKMSGGKIKLRLPWY